MWPDNGQDMEKRDGSKIKNPLHTHTQLFFQMAEFENEIFSSRTHTVEMAE